jgi:ABC-type branched-subunit amino acid transport system permease subunit
VAVAVVGVALTPTIVGAKLPVYTNGAIYVTIFVSLALLVRTSGQLSLCQLTFVAIGATTFSHLTTGAGLPWSVALVLAGLAVVPVGAIVSLPAIRLSGLYLALATFGFGILVERLVFNFAVMFGRGGQRSAPRPDFFAIHGPRGFFYVCAAIAALSILGAVLINRGKLGRLLRGLADSPLALAVNGADAKITRVIVFCISAFMAGIAGALFLALVGTASGSASGATFSTLSSITLLTVLAIAGRSLVVAPIIAATLFVIAPSYVTNAHLSSYLQIVFGGSALAVACLSGSSGAVLSKLASSTAWRRARSPVMARLQLATKEAP